MSLPTYTLEATVAGGPNTDLLALLNPAASGKTLKVWRFSICAPDATGQDQVIDYELRKITAITGGTAVVPARMRTAYGADGTSTAVSLPTSTTDIATETPLIMHAVFQLNQAIAPDANFVRVLAGPDCDPLVLEEGQGCVIKQIDNNTSTMRVGLVYTREDK